MVIRLEKGYCNRISGEFVEMHLDEFSQEEFKKYD